MLGGILVSLCLSPWPSFCPTFGVRSVTPTVLDGLFRYQAQMITSMRGCVMPNHLWPWHEFIHLWLCNKTCHVCSTAHKFWMDSFHIGHKWSLAWEGVLHIMNFDFNPYLQGFLLWPCLFYGLYIYDTNTTYEGQCVMYHFQVNRSKSPE